MIQKQAVYLPVKVEDELPENNKNVFCLTSDDFETELVFEDGVFRVYEGGDCYENENVTHWLKSQEAFVFTPEQLNEYTANVIEQALETAAENAETLLWQNNEDLEIVANRVDYIIEHIDIKQSITKTFEETFKRFKV